MNLAEFVYTVVLRPKPLKAAANFVICSLIRSQLKVGNSVVVLNPRDPVVSGALNLGMYEKSETEFFRTICHPGMTVLDIGANIGYYTAMALDGIGKEGKVIALEPDPENFAFLQRTVEANHASNVISVNKAASSSPGRLTLYTSASNRGDNRLYANDLCEGEITVDLCTIDGLLDNLGIESVDVIKMDVQGFEGHVIRGMKETLARSRKLTLLSEFWPFGLNSAKGPSPMETLEALEEAGLTLYELSSRGSLVPIADKHRFIERFPGRRYTNIVGIRQP